MGRNELAPELSKRPAEVRIAGLTGLKTLSCTTVFLTYLAGTIRENRGNHHGIVKASLSCWRDLRSDSQCCQFVDTSSNTGDRHARDEVIHGVGRAANNHSDDEERSSDDSNISSSEEVR